MNWYLHAFKQMFNYKGRARRAEYGWTLLCHLLVQLAAFLLAWVGILAISLIDRSGKGLVIFELIYNGISLIYFVLMLLVMLSLTARRLHDLGYSGWWQLLPIALLFATFAALPVLETFANDAPIIAVYLAFITSSISSLTLFLLLCFKDGHPTTNQYGESPKA